MSRQPPPDNRFVGAFQEIRKIPHCIVSGQGTGAAAALSVLEKKDLDSIDIKKLQKKLREQNVLFEPDESIELPDQDTRTKFIF